MEKRKRSGRHLKILLVIAVITAVFAPVAVVAAGGAFTDDDDSIFEANIEWLASAGVTKGCNPPENTLFCPTDNVTRGQMAAFMQRFAQYIGAEDGTPAEADHATSADTATNANTVDGKNAIEFQPTTNAFESAEESISANGVYTIASGTVSTTDGSGYICLVGSTPTADIRVHGSGHVSSMSAGEEATFYLADSDGQITGTTRVVSESNGSFAMEWLYELVPGGSETFSLVATEATGDTFNVNSAVILVEVLSDTRCKGSFPIIIGLGSGDSENPDFAAAD